MSNLIENKSTKQLSTSSVKGEVLTTNLNFKIPLPVLNKLTIKAKHIKGYKYVKDYLVDILTDHVKDIEVNVK